MFSTDDYFVLLGLLQREKFISHGVLLTSGSKNPYPSGFNANAPRRVNFSLQTILYHRRLKFGPYITSITSKPKAHKVITVYMMTL